MCQNIFNSYLEQNLIGNSLPDAPNTDAISTMYRSLLYCHCKIFNFTIILLRIRCYNYWETQSFHKKLELLQSFLRKFQNPLFHHSFSLSDPAEQNTSDFPSRYNYNSLIRIPQYYFLYYITIDDYCETSALPPLSAYIPFITRNEGTPFNSPPPLQTYILFLLQFLYIYSRSFFDFADRIRHCSSVILSRFISDGLIDLVFLVYSSTKTNSIK